jgi:hypothetical protein
MSRTVAIGLCLLLSIKLAVLALNLSRPSQAAGLKAKELDADPDFVIAVKAIVNKCSLNINLAAVKC